MMLKPTAIAMAVALGLSPVASMGAEGDNFRELPRHKFLLVWSADQMLDGNNQSPLDGVLGVPAGALPDADFVAVFDADPRSRTYGQVVNTAEMPAVNGQHLLSATEDFVDDALELALSLADPQSLSGNPNGQADGDILGGVPNFNGAANGLPAVVPAPSAVLNESHHHSVRPYVDPNTGKVLSYYGGLISSNVFGCDISDPMNIKPAPNSDREDLALHGQPGLTVGTGTLPVLVDFNDAGYADPNNVCGLSVSGAVNNDFSGLDDLEYNPANGMYYTTMMGAGGSFLGVFNSYGNPNNNLSLPPVLTTPGGLQVFDPATDTVLHEISAVPDMTNFGAASSSVFGHGFFADGSPMIGPERYAPRVQLGLGGVDGNGKCVGPASGGTFADGTIATAVGANAFNLCVPGNEGGAIGPDTGAVDLDAGINEGPDTALLAHPHGIGLRTDLNGTIADADGTVIGTTQGIIMTSDYADPVSLALTGSGEGAASSKQNLGTTIRLWDLANPQKGPYQVIEMPDGNRHEDNAIHEEPEGLMAMRVTHGTVSGSKGAFVASMCGGSIFYAPDITVAKPEFKLVYDTGACTGASVFTITQDDRTMFLPIAGIQTDGDPIHDRDYAGEHNRRIAVLDLTPLMLAGANHTCDKSPASAWDNTGIDTPLGEPETHGPSGVVYNNPGDLFNGSVYHPNNGSSDCPKLVDNVDFSGAGDDGVLNTADDHPDNETSRGGPHFTTHDRFDRYVSTNNYFVDLREFAIKDVGLLLSALGLGHAWDNGSGGTVNNAYPPGGPGVDQIAPGGLGPVFDVLGIPDGHANALPGTGSVGDDTVCMMRWNRWTKNLSLDTRFNRTDATSPTGCNDLDFGDSGKQWPTHGTRHADAGNATPHGSSFVTVGVNQFFSNGE